MIGEKKVLLQYLVDSFNNEPESWRWVNEKKYFVSHSSGLRLWVSGDLHVYEPNEIKWGWWERRHLRRAFRNWKKTRGNAEAVAIERANCSRAISLLKGEKKLRAA